METVFGSSKKYKVGRSRGVLFGGNALYGATARLAYAYSLYAPSSAAAYFGSRN